MTDEERATEARVAAAREFLATLGLESPTLRQMRAAVAAIRKAEVRGRDETIEKVEKVCRDLRGSDPLSLVSDPYRRGCIDTANAIEEAVRALKSGGKNKSG